MSHDGTLQRALFALNGQRPQEALRQCAQLVGGGGARPALAQDE
ncbi:MAG TPA: hypothetical protein VMR17_05360 [Xanthobacteraceae bacterium]|jgi:hypothetical protein|nr:hypothetical protein [Xanthobacteraceae bacterium]